MQEYLKRYFWVLGAIVVMVCALLAAKAVNHYIEARFLGESNKSKKTARAAPKKKGGDKAVNKAGEPLAARNMFCSECLPPEPDEDETTSPGDTVPLTKLPLQLVATNVSTKSEYSFATIRDTDSERQGAYWIGDEVPGAGPIEVIRGKHVDFRNDKRLERVSLLAGDAPKPKTKTAAKSDKPDELSDKLDAGIKKISDNEFEIDRSLVDELLENPMAVAKGARIVPSVKNGKANGFKLYAIRPSSVYAKLGLKNGDTIHAVNGFELTTPDKALEVYSKVKESNNLEIDVTRRGKSESIKYGIR